MGPHGALNFAPVARYVDQTTVIVGGRRAGIGRLSIDLVAPRQRPAPAVVVERSGEVVTVGSAVALRAVVSVVVMELRLVAAEAVRSVIRAIDRRVVVDAGDDRFAIPRLDQERWKGSLAGDVARSVRPDAVRILRREVGMEFGVGRTLRPRHHVADLGEELLPPLMRKEGQAGFRIGRSTSLDRTHVSDWIDKSRIAGIVAEVVVI